MLKFRNMRRYVPAFYLQKITFVLLFSYRGIIHCPFKRRKYSMGNLICSNPGCRNKALYGKFCTKCGGGLIKLPEFRCANCKNLVGEGHIFCADCGMQIQPHKDTIPEEMRLIGAIALGYERTPQPHEAGDAAFGRGASAARARASVGWVAHFGVW